MKIKPDAVQNEQLVSGRLALHLPFGLIGLRHLTHFELEPAEEGMAFQILRAVMDPTMEFVVVEPGSVLEDYKVALRDEDVESLQITHPGDALVLNIVFMHSLDPQHVTVNLVGPLVVNRKTMVGQQVIIENSADYSIEHVLVDQRPEAANPGT